MPLQIIDKHNFERKARISKILWSKKARFYKKLILWLAFIGLVFIAISLASTPTFYTEVSGRGTYYNLNLLFSIGLAIIFLSLICFQIMRIDRKTFFERDEDPRSSETWQKETKGIIEIDDEVIRTNYENLKQEIKWPMFSKYMFRDDILFLSTSNYDSYILTIDRRQMDKDTFDQLFALVKTKIPEKETTKRVNSANKVLPKAGLK
jgi:hypothetical protein